MRVRAEGGDAALDRKKNSREVGLVRGVPGACRESVDALVYALQDLSVSARLRAPRRALEDGSLDKCVEKLLRFVIACGQGGWETRLAGARCAASHRPSGKGEGGVSGARPEWPLSPGLFRYIGVRRQKRRVAASLVRLHRSRAAGRGTARSSRDYFQAAQAHRRAL